jgi:hypothetical protein
MGGSLGERQFYIDAIIKTIETRRADEEAFEKARSALEFPLGVVKRWTRESDMKDRELGVTWNADDVLDHNYRSREVLSLFSCPVE